MTPEVLGALHARAIAVPRPWTAAEFADLLGARGVFLIDDPAGRGFALGRVAGPEAELLTLVVAPEARRQGIARDLLGRFAAAARARGATASFLEVAASNGAARTLYAGAGWRETGRRRNYYAHDGGAAEDAVVMARDPL
jgi:ribosomal-protein-alanine N-acetyltransferase